MAVFPVPQKESLLRVAFRRVLRRSGPPGVQEGMMNWLRAHRGLTVASLYLAAAAAVAVLSLGLGLTGLLKLLIVMGDPVASLTFEAVGPWPGLVIGLLFNATAIGMVVASVTRFSSRLDGMLNLADRVLNRPNH